MCSQLLRTNVFQLNNPIYSGVQPDKIKKAVCSLSIFYDDNHRTWTAFRFLEAGKVRQIVCRFHDFLDPNNNVREKGCHDCHMHHSQHGHILR